MGQQPFCSWNEYVCKDNGQWGRLRPLASVVNNYPPPHPALKILTSKSCCQWHCKTELNFLIKIKWLLENNSNNYKIISTVQLSQPSQPSFLTSQRMYIVSHSLAWERNKPSHNDQVQQVQVICWSFFFQWNKHHRSKVKTTFFSPSFYHWTVRILH